MIRDFHFSIAPKQESDFPNWFLSNVSKFFHRFSEDILIFYENIWRNQWYSISFQWQNLRQKSFLFNLTFITGFQMKLQMKIVNCKLVLVCQITNECWVKKQKQYSLSIIQLLHLLIVYGYLSFILNMCTRQIQVIWFWTTSINSNVSRKIMNASKAHIQRMRPLIWRT